MKKVISFLLALLFFFSAGFLCVQAEERIEIEAVLGYEGLITYLKTMPLQVTVKNNGDDAALTVAVNVSRSEREYDRYEYPITLAGGAQRAITIPLLINYKQEAYTIEVLRHETVVAKCEVKPQQTVIPSTLLVGVLSNAPEVLSYMDISSGKDTLLRREMWQTVPLTMESFPGDQDMLSAFRVLVVDGVDVNTLSEAQREALDAWLRGGGILIAGGGAAAVTTLRAFAPYTGITAAQPYQARGVEKALYDYFADTQFPMTAASSPSVSGTRDVMLADLRGGQQAVVALNGKTLIARSEVDAGVVYTTAFSLSERPLSVWSGMGEIWQRMLLSADHTRYQTVIGELNNYYAQGPYANSSLLSSMKIENTDNVLLALLVTLAFILLSGVGSYVVLKKLDKREWMWFTVPALSLLCAAVTVMLGSSMQMSKPAMAEYTIITVDQSGVAQRVTMAGVASADTQSFAVSALSGDKVSPGQDYSANSYVDDEIVKLPKKLRYRFVQGEGAQTLMLPANDMPWTVQTVQIEAPSTVSVPVHAAIWWEKDGLHGEIRNDSNITLSDGYVFTDLGYCTVPALLPGQTAQIAILEDTDKDPNQEMDRSFVEEGVLVSDMYAYSYGMYSIVDSALWPDRQLVNEGALVLEDDVREERASREKLIRACQEKWGEFGIFRYVTFNDALGQIPLALNGKPIERTAYRAVIDVAMEHRAIGKSGVVRLSRGMIPRYEAALLENGAPARTGKASQNSYGYFDLRDDPVLCFALGEVNGMDLEAVTIDRVTLNFECYDGMPLVYIYNFDLNSWQEVKYSTLPIQVEGKAFAPCLDARGQVFVRFKQDAAVSNMSIYNPVFTLEGRVE